MIDHVLLDEQLSELPLYIYTYIDPSELEFSPRIRHICQSECPMYGQTWASLPVLARCRNVRKSAVTTASVCSSAHIVEVTGNNRFSHSVHLSFFVFPALQL